jgi:hypothetical protein
MKLVLLSAPGVSIVAAGKTGRGVQSHELFAVCDLRWRRANCRFVSFVQRRAPIGGNDGVWNRNVQSIPGASGRFNLRTFPFNRRPWSSR